MFPQKEKSHQNPQPGVLKRHTSLTDLSQTHEQQELEYLRLQISEQRGAIDELTQVRLSARMLRSSHVRHA